MRDLDKKCAIMFLYGSASYSPEHARSVAPPQNERRGSDVAARWLLHVAR